MPIPQPTSPHVLVVDDNPVARTVLVRQLERAGFVVDHAADGVSALRLIVEKPVELVLLDFVMEPMGGLEVLERIRRVRSPLQIPVIMMSATRDQSLIVQATELGANDFLLRPLQLPVLQAKIRQLLQMCRSAPESDPGQGKLEVGSEMGPYKIEALLGEGAMGRVFKATDTRLLRTVAIKVLWEHRLKEESAEQFLQEARALARVQHPHVATIYDVGLGRNPFMVMEFVEGVSLAVELEKGRPSLEKARAWGVEILQALGAIHSQGLVHRDLKPDNILLSNDGQIKVVDFGVAQFMESGKSSTGGKLQGTPEWMSPEQIGEGMEVDARSDLFSLAAILYSMLTGKHPFPAEGMTQQLFLISTQDPVPLRELNAEIPEPLEKACLQGLSKDPRERFPSAEAFAEALRG